MSEEKIPTEVIKLIINTLGFDAIIPKEQELGYFIRKKLKQISTLNQWLTGERKRINQFMNQRMFGETIIRDTLPENTKILRPHWQYLVK